ncbi:MAG: DUF4465 domain-containing protein [Muribaculaceae bacterium]|nr:DUF4465 domain-containing protein [Muribaculaceae bacterium]
MKKTLLLLALATSFSAIAADNLTLLDLSKSTTPLEFNNETGAWTETYNDDATVIKSQCFNIVHSSVSEWMSWSGFTASNSADNTRRDNTIKFQFSNMACGGIDLNEDGSIKLDEFGAPVVSAEMPYLVGFYSSYGENTCTLTMADGLPHRVNSAYFNLNSYPYYCIEYGDAYARAFTNGDKLTLTIHGVAADETEKTVDVTLASFSNGDLTINRGWKLVDLSSLGAVNQLYFTMSSTDTSEYGMNTPAYFCMDKLSVISEPESSIASVGADTAITYDRASTTVYAPGFLAVYDTAGNRLISSENGSADISTLPAGVYLVKSAGACRKIVR